MFMYDYHSGNLPDTFNSFFLPVNQRHKYNTRLASRSSYCLPRARTNYGKFNIRFIGAKVWNQIDEKMKNESKSKFKKVLKSDLLESYTKLNSE